MRQRPKPWTPVIRLPVCGGGVVRVCVCGVGGWFVPDQEIRPWVRGMRAFVLFSQGGAIVGGGDAPIVEKAKNSLF